MRVLTAVIPLDESEHESKNNDQRPGKGIKATLNPLGLVSSEVHEARFVHHHFSVDLDRWIG
jgi:hypothetical protein